MAGFPQLVANTPVVVSKPVVVQSQEVSYDLWWMRDLRVTGHDPNGSMDAFIELQRGRKLEDGSWELHPEIKTFQLSDLFALAATDENVANALGLILTIIKDRLASQL